MIRAADNLGRLTGEVVSVHKTGFYVRVAQQQHFCIVNNSYKNSESPVVNDNVVLEKRDDQYIIIDLMPRKSFIARYDFYKERYQGFAANVDTAFIVTSANMEFSANRVRRFLMLLEGQNVRKVIVLTKTDMTASVGEYEKKLAAEFGDIEHIMINSCDPSSAFKLLKYFKPNGTALLMGSSGVGKSTIINTLCGTSLKTGEIQGEKHANKGKHTTSARTLYFLPDGRKIIDTPGIRIVGVEGMDTETRAPRRKGSRG